MVELYGQRNTTPDIGDCCRQLKLLAFGARSELVCSHKLNAKDIFVLYDTRT